MKFKYFPIIILFFQLFNYSCNSQKNKEVKVLISTDLGDIKLKLYNETPLHRDNFIKLIKSGFYKERIFHRVINQFMIQGGDESLSVSSVNNSKGTFNYTVPAEFNRILYHKKGALAAARQGDEINPNKESSSTQFYIVQGQVFTLDQLKQIEIQINNQIVNSQYNKYFKEEENKMMQKDAPIDYKSIQTTAKNKAKADFEKNPFKYTDEQIKVYTTRGGTPFLDANYTVFGEVIDGFEVINKIAAVKTLPGDRPEKDIKFSIKIY